MSIKESIRKHFDFGICGKCVAGEEKNLCGVGQCILNESVEIEKIDQLTRIADALEKIVREKNRPQPSDTESYELCDPICWGCSKIKTCKVWHDGIKVCEDRDPKEQAMTTTPTQPSDKGE